MAKVLMKGNEAMALAAIKGGCDAFFGYPITPQNEIPEYLSYHMKTYGRVFVQAESEVAAINMVYGAAGAGARVLTSSSSPGIALKQEGISYIVGSELPCVIINVMRGGPGLGGIQPSQADYNQITRGGGNGDYHMLAYAPESLQETVDVVKQAFDLADYYRNPVMIAVDGLIGQMMEPVDIDKKIPKKKLAPKTWAADGKSGERGERNKIVSLHLDPYNLEKHNLKLQKKYDEMIKKEQRYELINLDQAEVVIVAYGSMARIARSAINTLKKQGINVGIIRPIAIWPFPEKAFNELPETVHTLLTVEMSLGQMIQDVKIVNNGRYNIEFFGRTGGVVPEADEIIKAVKKIVRGRK
ncbi:3-methyl-2-oxobutanoate dehydrogenase subunit VorB [Liberiplasma polymorphum]|jgi:2-oxoglutarate/2-oxoacid ferredoxin oxidoreductase subunit alpha|uniref:3-methyl-2-oxobutanoate dehydrogenase subunit VorB n=1 Tax=Liberiplasma polymorphum TaxID=3374570 RepID=UPI0037738959